MMQHGPYPGQPQQPWSAGGADEPYQEPADPWGEHHDHDRGQHEGGWGGNPTSMAPGAAGVTTGHPGGPDPDQAGDHVPPGPYAQEGPDLPPVWGPSAPPPVWAEPVPTPVRRGRNGPIIALVVVLAILTCGGLGITAWLLGETDNTTSRVDPAPSTAITRPTGAAAPDPGPPGTSSDARFVAKGQCVRNEGTTEVPEMTISVCARGAYEVLARVDGRTTGEADAETKCAKVANYSKWYFYDSELDSLDFVLCLKER